LASTPPGVVDATTALARLRDGNRRFVDNVRSVDALLSQLRRAEMSQAQSPFAVVLGCSDSRVPAEVVFDQGLGDLFVVRVAGNVVAPSQVASVDFALERFGTRLVVVMGHTRCSAVDAAIEEALGVRPVGSAPHLEAVVGRVRPVVEALVHAGLGADRGALAREAVRTNARVGADHLRHGSRLVETMTAGGLLLVVAAEYDLETGAVDFFDLPAGTE
jgi:carbonic anhydrase